MRLEKDEGTGYTYSEKYREKALFKVAELVIVTLHIFGDYHYRNEFKNLRGLNGNFTDTDPSLRITHCSTDKSGKDNKEYRSEGSNLYDNLIHKDMIVYEGSDNHNRYTEPGEDKLTVYVEEAVIVTVGGKLRRSVGSRK